MNCTEIFNYDEPTVALVATVATSWLMVAVFGSFCNMLILIAVVKVTALGHNPATNIFIVSLCANHLLTCVTISWDVYTVLCRYDTWLQCRFDSLGTVSAVGMGMFNTGAIAVSRLLLVTRPRHYKWLFTNFKMAAIIIAFWALPPLAASVIPETDQSLFVTGNGTCSTQTLTPEYYRALAMLYFPIPTLVILCSYGLIYRHIRSHFNRYQSHVAPTRSLGRTSPSVHAPNSSSACISDILRRRTKEKNQIVNNIFLPIFVTIIFSLPLCVTMVIGEPVYIRFGITIYLCNLCVTPVVYGLKNPQLKVSIWKLLNGECPQMPQGLHSTTVNLSNFSRNRNIEESIQ